MPQGSSAVRPTNGLYLYLYLCVYPYLIAQLTKCVTPRSKVLLKFII